MKRLLAVAAAVIAPAATSWAANPYLYTNTTSTTSVPTPTPGITYTSYSYHNHGTLSLLSNATIGTTTIQTPWYYNDGISGPWTFYNGGNSTYGDGSTTFSGAVLNVGDSTHNVNFTVADVHTRLFNYSGDTINVAAGSTISLQTDSAGDTNNHSHASSVYNDESSTLNLGGDIQFQPQDPNGGTPVLLSNSGTINVTSSSATLERLAGPYVSSTNFSQGNAMLVNNGGSMLSGNGTLTYTNSTGFATMAGTTMVNYGTIAPGTTSAPGTLTLANINLEFGSGPPGILNIRLGGTAPGQYDVLDLTDPSGSGGGISFYANAALDVSLINGFTPQYGQTWTIMNYFSGPSSSSGIGVTPDYVLTMYPTYATLEFVPEPSTLGWMGLGTLTLLRRRRR